MKATVIGSVLLLAWQISGDSHSPKGKPMPLTLEQVQPIVQKYVSDWQAHNHDNPLWVSLAAPGDPINVPGVAFGATGEARAGMELPIRAHLIVINRAMIPESVLTIFTHEYGHAKYRAAHPKDFQEVDSEIAAIKSSLMMLPTEGFEYLAYREAAAIIQMSSAEPYRTAVQRLSTDPLWKKYSVSPQAN